MSVAVYLVALIASLMLAPALPLAFLLALALLLKLVAEAVDATTATATRDDSAALCKLCKADATTDTPSEKADGRSQPITTCVVPAATPASPASIKEIDIDTGVDYATAPELEFELDHDHENENESNHISVCSSLNDSSAEIDIDIDIDTVVANEVNASSSGSSASMFMLDEDDSFFLSSEVDSQFLQSGDLDVDWDLESIASVHSSLNDTDYILGGESLDSDVDVDADENADENADEDEDEDMYLRDWSSELDLESICSSLNDTDFLLGGETYDSDADSELELELECEYECEYECEWEHKDDAAFECSSLNDTDFLLGGESYDSDADSKDDLDLDDDTSSVSPTAMIGTIETNATKATNEASGYAPKASEDDDASTEDETDDEYESENESKLELDTEQSDALTSQIICCARVASAVKVGFVATARGSARVVAVDTVKSGGVAVSSSSKRSADRIAAAKSVAPVVRSRLYDFWSSPHFVAQREASAARALALREKSALAKAARFN